ncbi:hypothetical protein [Microbacterium murale]|uniref:Sugar ABC transporter ATPase n=1 Tax=Microbacterium murale TaxID=1081040 RepID=A0ABQ1S405_9MICO|nr:hypothetical protein [Microbacterium murale]GGD88801.1 hypothetical protein GCM10007269_34360 [Microbacterium murale]
MSNPNMASVPLPDDDRDEQATVEVDGDAVLDPDVDENRIDSAEADRLASEEESSLSEPAVEDQPDVLAADVPAGGAGADSGSVDAVQVDPDDEASIPDRSPLNDEPGVGTRRPDVRDGDSA